MAIQVIALVSRSHISEGAMRLAIPSAVAVAASQLRHRTLGLTFVAHQPCR